MAGGCIQRSDDVRRPILRLSGRAAWPAARSVSLRTRIYPDKLSAAVFSEPPGNAHSARACGTDRRNVLSAHAFLRSTQSPHALCAPWDRDVCDGYCLHNECRYRARSLVYGSPVLALDLLEWRGADPGN